MVEKSVALAPPPEQLWRLVRPQHISLIRLCSSMAVQLPTNVLAEQLSNGLHKSFNYRSMRVTIRFSGYLETVR